MAVDTRQKRMSMLNFGDGTNIHVLFEADGTVDADDRMHLLDLYSGFVSTGVESTMNRTTFFAPYS